MSDVCSSSNLNSKEPLLKFSKDRNLLSPSRATVSAQVARKKMEHGIAERNLLYSVSKE